MAEERLLPLPPLHALRTFHAAARFGRFREAATALGLSESAVSHQVRKLEDYLSVQLFEKAGNQVKLTGVGETYFSQIDPAFAAIRKATDELAGPCCRVSLTLPTCLTTLWLIPRLPRLEIAFPEISLQLVTTARLCDLRREQIDLAIRYGKGEWSGMTAQHLFDEQAFPVCRPGYLSAESERDPQQALRSARLIVNAGDAEEWREWASAHRLEVPSLRGAVTLDTSVEVLAAATEGLGLAIGRQPMIEHYLADGRLVAPFGRADSTGAAYYLVHPADVELSVSARRVARWLKEIAGGVDAQPTTGRHACSSQARSSPVSDRQPESAPRTRT